MVEFRSSSAVRRDSPLVSKEPEQHREADLDWRCFSGTLVGLRHQPQRQLIESISRVTTTMIQMSYPIFSVG
jgi:hypothetical protein